MCISGVVNCIWDLWAKLEHKTLFRLLCDISPEELVSMLDFSYVADVCSENDALNILNRNYESRKERLTEMEREGR